MGAFGYEEDICIDEGTMREMSCLWIIAEWIGGTALLYERVMREMYPHSSAQFETYTFKLRFVG